MKNIITLLLLINTLFVFGQQSELEYKDRLFVTIGVSYSPSLCNNELNEFKGAKSTYSPLFELTVGNRNFDLYAKTGNRLEFGVRGGNHFLMAGVGYSVDYNEIEARKHIAFFEVGFHLEPKKGVFLYISSKHGVLIATNQYFTAPISISLKFTINQ